jgi:hypothetical protein
MGRKLHNWVWLQVYNWVFEPKALFGRSRKNAARSDDGGRHESPVHFEIHGSNPDALLKFYGEVFGWSFTNYMPGEYWLIDTHGGINGA